MRSPSSSCLPPPPPFLASSSDRSLAISARSAATPPDASSFRTAEFLTSLARCANLSVLTVSLRLDTLGVTVATRQVLALPPQQSLRRNVSFESRKGTWRSRPCSRSAKAPTTCPKVRRLPLIMLASFNRSPSALVDFCLSDPARSTRVNLATRVFVTPLTSSSRSVLTVSTNTACDRDEARFIFVLATVRFDMPLRSTSMVLEASATGFSSRPSTYTPLLPSSRTDRPRSSTSEGSEGVLRRS